MSIGSEVIGEWRDDGFYDSAIGNDGGYVLAGWSEFQSGHGFDGWLVKITTPDVVVISLTEIILYIGILLPIGLIVVVQWRMHRLKKMENR